MSQQYRREDADEMEAFFSGERHLNGVRDLLEHKNDETEYEEIVYTEVQREHKGLRFLGAFLTALFVVGFVGACLFETYNLREEKLMLQAECDSLEAQINAEKAKVIEYKVSKAYYTSDQYKEDMARNRFRLIYQGEILIQVNEK